MTTLLPKSPVCFVTNAGGRADRARRHDDGSSGVAPQLRYDRRAVVVGNLMHLLVGAFVLVSKSASNDTVTSAFLVLTGLYVLGAALFVYLTFFSSGLRAKPASTSRAGA